MSVYRFSSTNLPKVAGENDPVNEAVGENIKAPFMSPPINCWKDGLAATRTRDLLLRRQSLYPPELQALIALTIIITPRRLAQAQCVLVDFPLLSLFHAFRVFRSDTRASLRFGYLKW